MSVHLNSFIIGSEVYFNKWVEFFEKDLKKLFSMFVYHLKKYRISREIDDVYYKSFCRLIYNKSSKRIPLY
jgi:hypothetical protein